MRRVLIAAGLAAAFAIPLAVRTMAQTAAEDARSHQAFVARYCVGCHSERLKTGGLSLEGLGLTSEKNAPVWEAALRKLRGRQMPPPGSPQPSPQEVAAFSAWLENVLDTQARGPRAGYVPLQRLNRSEYAAAVKALVGVEVNPKEILPQDVQVEGFDNIAEALSVSPAFLDQYVAAARQVARLAVGNPNPRLSAVRYPVGAIRNPNDPPPLGTRDGVKFRHNFPADGEYRITITEMGVGPYSNALENESTVVILIDGKVVFRRTIGGREDLALADRRAGTGRALIMERFSKIPVQVAAGVREVVVAFVERSRVETAENLERPAPYEGLTGSQAVLNRMARIGDAIEIAGPYNPTGVSRTPSRERIFVCDPREIGEAECARRIAKSLARRAFRRPATEEEVERLLRHYQAARRGGGSFDQGIEQLVAAVLASPQFLYRGFRQPPGGGEFALSDLELASRLSFFLWNAGPDEELLALAEQGALTRPGVLETQVRRMLADPQALSLVTSFAMKWLNLTDLEQVVPDPALFPSFTEDLRRDFLTEVEAFIRSVFEQDRSVVDLLTSERTYVNERLAAHYGIPGVTGSQFRWVTAPKERAGLLGKAAVLLRTSYGDRTSPVLRGAWVLDKLLGTPPSPPPPDTATDLSQKAGEAPKTVRARLEQHRAKASCNMCHGVIDPIGLALENMDVTGRWRDIDPQANAPIDARTVLPGGVAINGIVDLRAQLAARPAEFAQTVTERLMMYAINRRLEYFDRPQIRAIVRAAAPDNYRLSSLILGIVNSDAFRKQGAEPVEVN
jgi:mono/diheme cytochrome c family protein